MVFVRLPFEILQEAKLQCTVITVLQFFNYKELEPRPFDFTVRYELSYGAGSAPNVAPLKINMGIW